MAAQVIIIMIRTLIEAMRHAFHSVIRSNRATEQEQNMQLGKFGSNLIIVGAINAAVTILAIISPPEITRAYPTYMHVILSVILCFIGVSGLAGITIGMFMLSTDNPMHYRRLALVMLWASCVTAAFAIGVLLVATLSLASVLTSTDL